MSEAPAQTSPSEAPPSDVSPADAPPTVTVDLEVRYAETDQMGVVHHAGYLVWFEVARTHLCNQSGWHYAAIEDLGYFLVVTGTQTRHLKAAHYGNVVQVTCRLDRYSSRLLRFAYRVEANGVELATGSTEHVWVDRSTGKPCRTPPELRETFERLAAPTTASPTT